MAKGFTVKIRMEPWYADYVRSKLPDKNGFVFATETHDLGTLIKTHLKTRPDKPDKRKFNNSHVVFMLPDYTDINTLYKNYISPNAERMIQGWIKRKFYFDMHEHIIRLHHMGATREIKAAIIDFCETHEIKEEHYRYDSLKREYYRYRQKIDRVKEEKRLEKMSSVFLGLVSFLPPFIATTLSLIALI